MLYIYVYTTRVYTHIVYIHIHTRHTIYTHEYDKICTPTHLYWWLKAAPRTSGALSAGKAHVPRLRIGKRHQGKPMIFGWYKPWFPVDFLVL